MGCIGPNSQDVGISSLLFCSRVLRSCLVKIPPQHSLRREPTHYHQLGTEDKYRTCKLVLEDTRQRGLSSRTIALLCSVVVCFATRCYSAERGDATVSRLSVRLSVRP